MTQPVSLSLRTAALLLLVVTLVSHGASLWDGLAFDDYLHQANFRRLGWTPGDLIDSTTFQYPVRDMQCWWQPQSFEWRYARPVAFFFMKLEFVLLGGSPIGIHACALLWHFIGGLLVFRLADWALRSRWLAFLAATVFLIDPNAVSTVGWIAAHNALVGGVLSFAATLAYIHAAFDGHTPRTKLRPISLALAIVLWIGALFSRESSIAWLGMIGLLELTFGGWRHTLRRWPILALLTVIAGAFVWWRVAVFQTGDLPQIYFTTPHGFALVGWAAGKLLQLVFAQFIYTPMLVGLVTAGGLTWQHVATYAFMAAIMAALLWWYAWASRGLPGRWLWPGWCVLGFVPVVPVFVMPHFAYLPAAGHGIVLAVMLGRLRGKLRGVVIAVIIGLTLWSLLLYRWCWRGIVRSEQLVHADILDHVPHPPAGSELFFINLPVSGFYTSVALQEATGVRDLHGHVLTFAPSPLMMREPFTLLQTGADELTLRTPAPGYFAGFTGHMLVGGMWPGETLGEGRVIPGTLFDTTIVRGGAGGVTELRFRFHQPLASKNYYFFVSTRERGAWWMRMDPAYRGDLLAHGPDPNETAAWRQARAGWLAEREWFFTILDTARRIVRSDALLTN